MEKPNFGIEYQRPPVEGYEEINRDRVNDNDVMGASTLSHIQTLNPETQEDLIDKSLKRSAELFFERATDAEGIFSNGLIPEIKRLLNIDPSITDRTEILEQIDEKMLDPVAWRQVIEKHNAEYTEKHQIFQEEIEPGLREASRELLKLNIENGYLPVSPERVDDVIDRLVFYPSDVFYNPTSGGLYNPQTHSISIILDSSFPTLDVWSSEIKEELIQKYSHMYNHEILHALSGKTILRSLGEEDIDAVREFGDDPLTGQTGVQRSGVRFMKGKPNIINGYDSASSRFEWLDEAITESINKNMLHTQNDSIEAGIYAAEIELYRALIDKTGIEEGQFLKAYFEDYDPNAPEGSRVAAWNELKRAIDQELGPDFLVKLDDKVRSNGGGAKGARAGLKYLKSIQ